MLVIAFTKYYFDHNCARLACAPASSTRNVVLLLVLLVGCCGSSSGAPTAVLGLSAPRPCGRVGWLLFPLHLQSSVVVARAFVAPFRCKVFERSSCRAPTICTRSAQPCASLPDVRSASTRSPGESRTFSFRSVSRRPVLPNQSRHRCSRPPLKLWAPAHALPELRVYLTCFVSGQIAVQQPSCGT